MLPILFVKILTFTYIPTVEKVALNFGHLSNLKTTAQRKSRQIGKKSSNLITLMVAEYWRELGIFPRFLENKFLADFYHEEPQFV
jgi:hypothetical protein